MAKKTASSPVVTFLQTLWQNANKATGHSWERLNHAMYQGLRLAIGAGFEFTVADFRSLEEFRYSRWIGESTEWCYSMAIREGNQSAAVAYEHWVEREPIIADDVTPGGCLDAHFAHGSGARQRERLHVGCQFPWSGEVVTVTSFNKDGEAVACSYHPQKTDRCGYTVGERKIKSRYTITREAVVQNRAEQKERAALQKQFAGMVEAGKLNAKQILDELGIKTRQEYETLPLKKIRAVLEKMEKECA